MKKNLRYFMTLTAGLALLGGCGSSDSIDLPTTNGNNGNNAGGDGGDDDDGDEGGGNSDFTIVGKPNVIVMLVDDLGYSDLGCYGGEISTPNIDALAAQGIRYRTFYNNARSSPTRASLITGQYPHRVGQGALSEVPEGGINYQGSVRTDNNVFIPEVLKSSGYFSFVTGKWHIGGGSKQMAHSRGFDRSLTGQAGGFYFYNDPEKTGTGYMHLNGTGLLLGDAQLKPANWYSTDLWATMGMGFVDEALEAGKPFFWYLPFNGPHFPLQAPPATIAKYAGKYKTWGGYDAVRATRYEKQKAMGLFPDGVLSPRNPHSNNKQWSAMTDAERNIADNRMAIYAAIIEEIDKNVGLIVAHLKAKGVYENTVIMFLSDNGGNAELGGSGTWPGVYTDGGSGYGAVGSNIFLGGAWATVANTPYLYYKHHGHEGGCCTPFIVSYPNGFDASRKGSIDKTNYGHVVDIMPTVLELAGATNTSGFKKDGISLVPSFGGKTLSRPNPVFVEHEGNKMLRDGNWKITQEYQTSGMKWQLYNLASDPTELNDLSGSNISKLNEMTTKWTTMAADIGVNNTLTFTVGAWYVPVAQYFGQ